MDNKKNLLGYLEKASIFILGFLLIIFPLTFSNLTTDPFAIPKEIALAIGVLAVILLIGAKFVVEGSVKFRRTPFDLPIILFTIIVFASAILSVDQWDAIQSFIPLFLSTLLFFCITNVIKKTSSLYFLVASLGVGGVILSLVSLFSYLKIYVLPFDFARLQTFTPFGSLFDQAIYLVIVLGVVAYFAYPLLKNARRQRVENKNQIAFGAFSAIILLGVGVSIISVIKLQPSPNLPYEVGFQTGLAAISQDSGRILKSLLFGSGFGTYFTDFTRFRPASFNLNQSLWTISFFRSSSFVLELLATTGVLGTLSYIFLAYRVLRVKPLFIPAVIVFGVSLFLPFALSSMVLIFVVLGIFAALKGQSTSEKSGFFDIELHLVALKKGLFSLAEPQTRETSQSKALSIAVLIPIVVICILVGFYLVTFTVSDITFQKSFAAVAQNNGNLAYQEQSDAIAMFPNRDGYQRIFSQLNLTIANNLASSVPQGSSPSAQTQQTIYTLIQQSINSARQATTISPLTVTDWQNLSSVYRSLIGFGQNADSFAIVAAQQATALDPNNPQEYITLGGIFYQLGQWDNAVTQFQTAANLKPDYANAYYNLGHALEEKGDLKGAMTQLQTVKTLVAGDKANSDKIDSEIAALQKQIDSQGSTPTQPAAPGSNLNVDQSQVQLPAQVSPVKIPAPQVSPTPTPSASPTATPAPNLGQ